MLRNSLQRQLPGMALQEERFRGSVVSCYACYVGRLLELWLLVASASAQSSLIKILRHINSLGAELDLSNLGGQRKLAIRFDEVRLQAAHAVAGEVARFSPQEWRSKASKEGTPMAGSWPGTTKLLATHVKQSPHGRLCCLT